MHSVQASSKEILWHSRFNHHLCCYDGEFSIVKVSHWTVILLSAVQLYLYVLGIVRHCGWGQTHGKDDVNLFVRLEHKLTFSSQSLILCLVAVDVKRWRNVEACASFLILVLAKTRMSMFWQCYVQHESRNFHNWTVSIHSLSKAFCKTPGNTIPFYFWMNTLRFLPNM